MRSAKLIDIGKIEVVDVPAPVISRDTDVLVEVRAVGICGICIFSGKAAPMCSCPGLWAMSFRV